MVPINSKRICQISEKEKPPSTKRAVKKIVLK